MAETKGLKANAISSLESVMLGIGGTAPVYSLSASTASLVAAVGFMGPGSLLYAAIVMFGIAFAFMYLNRWRSDSGASYAWVGRSINPSLGFMSGWALLISTTLFMIAGSLPAGTVTLDLIAPKLANNVLAVTIAGAFWFIAMNILVMIGVEITAKFQKIMTIIEIGILIIITIGALIKFSAHPVHHFSWSWFLPSGFSFSTFVAGSLVAVFYYWGWDVTANLTEETADRHNAPGKGGVYGMICIFLLFELLQVTLQMGMSNVQINKASTNLLPVIGDLIFPRPWGDIAIIAVMISTIATLETSLLQSTRTFFSMGRDQVMNKKFGELHPKFKTPWVSSIVIGIVALVLFVLSTFSSGINSLMTDAINAIGLQIAFYYGLTGFSCAWYYRKVRDGKDVLMRIVWPLAAGIFLWFIAIYDIKQLDLVTNLVGIGSLVIGIFPLMYYRRKYRSSFYTDGLESWNPDFPTQVHDPSIKVEG
ncbi:APC family permease [Neobacillus ginsengisoli]|uniref:Amino acid transporter n=1 Tax=Neobacillus ginsengisoli TaxID=904295 RepID=A0ABT9XT49_9BACI|nr:APC family permease [Neobacillus ginsengisoli]MDQ0198728.1 amino acid transporter [Neobacillus ginsengisoli]